MAKIKPPLRGAEARRPQGLDVARMLRDPTFQDLTRKRSSFAWTLSALMLLVYLAFILLDAFDKPLMASSVFGGATSLGIVLGLAVIVFAFLLTGVYISRANRVFDSLSDEIKRKVR